MAPDGGGGWYRTIVERTYLCKCTGAVTAVDEHIVRRRICARE